MIDDDEPETAVDDSQVEEDRSDGEGESLSQQRRDPSSEEGRGDHQDGSDSEDAQNMDAHRRLYEEHRSHVARDKSTATRVMRLRQRRDIGSDRLRPESLTTSDNEDNSEEGDMENSQPCPGRRKEE